MSTVRGANWAACLNLLVPGAGVILVGSVWAGLLTGLAFVLCANYALWATFLIPDEFSRWSQALGIGVAAGTYFGAQVRLAQAVRGRERRQQADARRAALSAAQACLLQADHAGALDALKPVRDLAGSDLLIAYRTAQAHAGVRDTEAARAAWRRVRELDRHHVYREQTRAAERSLGR